MKTADKVIGLVLAAIALGLGGWGLHAILPTLIELAQNTVYFLAMLGVVGVLLVVLGDPQTWRNLYYGWRNISRKIRNLIISSDPIGILETVIRKFQQKLEEIDANIVQADGAAKRQETAIKNALRDRDKEIGLAAAAEKIGKQLQVSQHAVAAKRWEDSATEMEPMLVLLRNALKACEQARDLCAVKLEDAKNQKLVMQRKLEALLAGQSAVRKLKSFFTNNPDLEMQEQAIEAIELQSTEAMAEIDQFMRVVNPLIENADLQKSADQAIALSKYNEFIKGSQLGFEAIPVPAGMVVKEIGPVQPKQLVQEKGK
jgi:hypothetical protein